MAPCNGARARVCVYAPQSRIIFIINFVTSYVISYIIMDESTMDSRIFSYTEKGENLLFFCTKAIRVRSEWGGYELCSYNRLNCAFCAPCMYYFIRIRTHIIFCAKLCRALRLCSCRNYPSQNEYILRTQIFTLIRHNSFSGMLSVCLLPSGHFGIFLLEQAD